MPFLINLDRTGPSPLTVTPSVSAMSLLRCGQQRKHLSPFPRQAHALKAEGNPATEAA